jgi:hypothetical protein
MSETTPSIEKLEKQLRVLQRKLERSEWHRVDLENQHDRDQHLYRRLQADLEAARRAAEIEASLERVRSRAIAMRHSDELGELSYELVKQVQELGVDTWHCAFNIYDEGAESSTEWGANANGFYPIYKTPRVGIFRHYYEIGKSGADLHVEVIGEDRAAEHYEALCALPGVGEVLLRLRESGVPFPERQVDHVAYFKYGYLIFITFEPAPEAHDIFRRFAKAFEQTYTRFLDLQRAEDQAREAEIEAALERVRSRAMAMRSSDELPEAANLLFQQVQSLGMPAWSAGYCIWDEDRRGVTQWVSTEGKLLPSFRTPLTEDPAFIRMREAHERGEPFFVEEIGGDALAEHYRYMSGLPVVGDLITALLDDGFPLPTFQIFHCAYFSHGFLLFITYEPVPTAHPIFQRFAKVFDQTYTRYLDLKQAEAQAREARIETAMERVRSRALAMTSSEELLDVVFTIRKEFAGLGLACGAFWHTRYTPEAYHKALTSLDGEKLAAIMELPRDFASNPDLAAWEHGDEPIGVFPFDAEAGAEYMYHMAAKGKFSEIDPDAVTVEMVREHGGITFVQARTSHGEIGYSLWGEAEPSEEAKDVLVRFATTFDLAYRRFLDLQQAEEAARYLQAENERKTRELEGARALQLSMLPKTLPVHPCCELAASMQTATEVGGDYYDFDMDEDGTLTLAIGDATGHGLQAGTMVTATKSLFLLHAREKDLAAVLRRATLILQRMGMRKLFMALALVRLRDGVLELAGAGMPPALVYRAATGSVETVALKGLPLGSALPFPYRTQRVQLAPEDTVVLMSDGFPELFDADGAMLGYERAASLLTEIGGASAEEVIARFEETARAWAGGRALDDDITFVVLKARIPASGPVPESALTPLAAAQGPSDEALV